jgi:ferrochelatase
MAKDGVERALCFATSAFDSPTGNQRYADALESAREATGAQAPILEKLPLPFEHPLFIEAQTDHLLETLAWHSLHHLSGTPVSHILFSAHSIPIEDAARSHYVEQLQTTCRSVIEKSGTAIPWELVYQSRSGPASHWLGPDIMERISELAAQGIKSVIVSPLGFFCENRETEYDLDIEVGEHCEKLGLSFYRAKAVGAMPKICRLILALARQ